MAQILVIDDDDLVRESLQILLEDRGHQVTTAENGKIGMKHFLQRSFDLIITDIFMPEKEGYETLAEIRANNPSVKILVISGGGRDTEQQHYLEQAELLGANASLAKPFLTSELLDRISELLP